MRGNDTGLKLLHAVVRALRNWLRFATRPLQTSRAIEPRRESRDKESTPATAQPDGQPLTPPAEEDERTLATPPAFWVERARSAGPPAHWLEQVEKARAAGEEGVEMEAQAGPDEAEPLERDAASWPERRVQPETHARPAQPAQDQEPANETVQEHPTPPRAASPQRRIQETKPIEIKLPRPSRKARPVEATRRRGEATMPPAGQAANRHELPSDHNSQIEGPTAQVGRPKSTERVQVPEQEQDKTSASAKSIGSSSPVAHPKTMAQVVEGERRQAPAENTVEDLGSRKPGRWMATVSETEKPISSTASQSRRERLVSGVQREPVWPPLEKGPTRVAGQLGELDQANKPRMQVRIVDASYWPALPEEESTDMAHDAAPTLREQERRARLDAEQRGIEWNG